MYMLLRCELISICLITDPRESNDSRGSDAGSPFVCLEGCHEVHDVKEFLSS